MKIYRTAKSTREKLAPAGEPEFEQKPDEFEERIVNVYPEVTFQKIEGFGGAFTEAVSATLDTLPKEKRDEILRLYFDPDEGIGYTLCRTHINSCDFSLDNYSCDDVPGDTSLEHFSIDRDRKSLLPLIKEALEVSKNGFKLFASPWSPPKWMKTIDDMNNGGKLREECRGVWAEYLARFVNEYKKEGVDLWGLTVQNEAAAVQTWDSCVYTAEEERDFVKILGPTLEKEGLGDLKLMYWDHNKQSVLERSRPILEDPEAAKYVWGIAVHFYSGDHFESLDAFSRLYPDKMMLATEAACLSSELDAWWGNGEAYAHDIVGDLKNGCCGWVNWNLALNELGGPNHVENYCDAPVIVDRKSGTYSVDNSFYYMGHFSKFVRPGAKRVLTTSFTEKLETCGFVNRDGSQAVVILNRTEDKVAFNLRRGKEAAAVESLPHSILTIVL